MRKKINLLLTKKDYQKNEKHFGYFRTLTVIFGAISFVCLLIVFFNSNSLDTNISKLEIEKETYVKEMIKRTDQEAKINLFTDKNNYLKNVIQNDVNFVPYYDLIKKNLPISTDSARIEKIDFNNKKEIIMVLSFADYEAFYNFIGHLQDKSFLNIFKRLTLDSFTISEQSGNNYQLTFKGVLNPLKKDATKKN